MKDSTREGVSLRNCKRDEKEAVTDEEDVWSGGLFGTKTAKCLSIRFTFITASFLACAGVSIETNVNNFLIGPNVIKFQENVQSLSWRY